jgi:hypothetical protein
VLHGAVFLHDHIHFRCGACALRRLEFIDSVGVTLNESQHTSWMRCPSQRWLVWEFEVCLSQSLETGFIINVLLSLSA